MTTSLVVTFARLLVLLAVTTCTTNAQDLRLDGGKERGWDSSNWYVTVDGIMGGDSDGAVVYREDNTVMSFSGNIVREGGGFSSIRKELEVPVDLSPYAGIVIELQANLYSEVPAPFGVHFQLADESSRWEYAAAFAVPLADSANTTAIYMPLEAFDRASRGGSQCRDASECTLDASSVNYMDFDVLFQEGPFELNVHSITAVQNETSFPSPVMTITSANQVRSLIQDTIRSGGDMYDAGYDGMCIAVYRSALNTLMASSGGAVTEAMKMLICDGLEQAAAFDYQFKADIAWSLRGTLDSVWDTAEMDSDSVVIVSRAGTWQDHCMAVTSHPPVMNMMMMDTNSTSFNQTGP